MNDYSKLTNDELADLVVEKIMKWGSGTFWNPAVFLDDAMELLEKIEDMNLYDPICPTEWNLDCRVDRYGAKEYECEIFVWQAPSSQDNLARVANTVTRAICLASLAAIEFCSNMTFANLSDKAEKGET